MDSTPGPSQIIKVEHMDTTGDEINIEENIVIDENTEVLTLNNENIQFEFFDVKNFGQNEIIVKNSHNNLEEENRNLKKEFALLSEKFQLVFTQSQNQAKLIELFIRLDMIRNFEEPDRKELEDLQRKIELCCSVIEEYNIKYNELCNEKRRILLATPSEPEKKAAIWDHFTILADADGQRSAQCNYCGRCFNYKSLSANKCREHIYDRCDKAPESVRTSNKTRNDPQQKSKYSVWNYFLTSEKNGKTLIVCSFCDIEYSSRNATKCREHLAFKCPKIDQETQEQMKATFSQEYINSFNTNKRSSIWEHYNIIVDDDKVVIQCIYCCMNYANKNATKCREHLLERCDKIPIAIRHRINNSFFESPLKTWTQIKVPIWKHFSIISIEDRKQYKCNYCEKIYSSKNVTKFRLHLLTKCQHITPEVKQVLSNEVSRIMVNKGDEYNPDIGQESESYIADEMTDSQIDEEGEPDQLEEIQENFGDRQSEVASDMILIKQDIDEVEEEEERVSNNKKDASEKS